MSSACARASLSRSRYSASSSSDSAFDVSAASIESSIELRRACRAPPGSRGNANLFRTQSVTRKATSVQIISPTFGLTRKLLLLLWSRRVAGRWRASVLAEEEGDEAEDERVEHDRLGQREAEPLDRGDLVAHLGLAGHRLDDLAEDVADADARADGAEAGADAERDGLAGLAPVLLGDVRAGADWAISLMRCRSTVLVLLSALRRPRRRGRWL